MSTFQSMKRPLVVGSETGALIAQAYALSYPQAIGLIQILSAAPFLIFSYWSKELKKSTMEVAILFFCY